MKKEKWYYEAQRLFKEWKTQMKLSGDCIKQTITKYHIEEVWMLHLKDIPSAPAPYELHAFKNNKAVYLIDASAERIWIQQE